MIISLSCIIEHDGVKMNAPMEWRNDAFLPCPNFTGGCFMYPLRRLQKQDTDLGLLFYFVMHVFNKAGHFTTIKTDSFQLPSMFPPGHGLVFDLDPSLVDETGKDVDVHFTQEMLCSHWSGFLHHESVVLEFGVGTSNHSDDVLAFQTIPSVTSYCSHNKTFRYGTRYYVLIRATCSGGSTISSSNGVLIINETSIKSELEVNIGIHPINTQSIQESFVISNSPFKLRFSKALDVGEAYLLLFSDNFTIRSLNSTDGIVQIEEGNYIFISFIPFPVINLQPLINNTTVTVKVTKRMSTAFIQDTDRLFIYWKMDLPFLLSVSVGMYAMNASASSSSLFIPFEHPVSSAFHKFENLSLQQGIPYQVGLQICSTAVCVEPKLSDLFYIDTKPTSAEIIDAVLTPLNPTECINIQLQWKWKHHTQHVRFFQWNLAKSDQCDPVFREWSTVLKSNLTMYSVSRKSQQDSFYQTSKICITSQLIVSYDQL